MKKSQTMWEPEWDFTSNIEPPFEGSIPLSLADENCQNSLSNTYRYFLQICLPADFTDNNHRTWKAIADTLGTTFTPGLSFWDAIGITDHQKQKELASRFRQPYFGDIDITTWQSLRKHLGLPDGGVLYADYIMYDFDAKTNEYVSPIPNHDAVIRRTHQNYRYFVGKCIGETTDGNFESSNGSSYCWANNRWLIFVDDLTRLVVCTNSLEERNALLACNELECYPLHSPSR